MKRKMKKLSDLALTSVLMTAEALSGCSSDKSASGAGDSKREHITATLYDRGNVPPEAGTIDNNRWTKWINEKGPTVSDMWRRSIVGGSKYTPEQALADVQDLWKRSGGPKIDQFYSDWITNNPNDVIYSRDFIKQINEVIGKE